MATFQVKVEDLIGSVNDTQLISDSLTSSAAELLSALPKECLWVVSTSTGDITAANYNVEKCLILNVLRENGTDGDYHNCHEVPSSYFGHVQDVNSVWYPSTSEPVYLLKNGHVFVYPAPGVSPNAFQVEYVTNPTVAFGSSAITGFPDEYESVVVTGAAMKCTIRLMSDSVVSITAVPPDVPGLPNISYSSAAVGDAVSSAVDSITAGPTDAAGVSATTATTDVTGSTASSYTAPGVEGTTVAKGLLSMTDGTINTDGDQIDYDKFWDVLAEYIESEEDVELASAQLSKIRTYIDAFQAEVQNASAAMQATIEDARQATQASVANAGNDTSIYGASISSQTQASIANAGNDVNASIAKMGQSTSAAIQKMSLSTNVNIQNATKVMDALVQDYNLTINRYSQELNQYQAEVSKEIEESNSKFSQYAKLYDNLTKEYERGLTVITSRFKQYSPQQASS